MGEIASEQYEHWYFLRGMVRETAHWDNFLPHFKAALPKVNLHFLDLPGCGRHHRVRSPTDTKAMADFVRADFAASLETTGIATTKRFLLSMSLGSMVAVQWFHRYPQDFFGGVILNTSFRNLSRFDERMRMPSLLRGLRLLLVSDARVRERTIFRLTCNAAHKEAETVAHWAEIHRRRPVSPGNFFRQIIAAARATAPDHPPLKHLLVVNSAKDRLVNPRCSQTIHKQWKLPFVTHPSAGHDLPVDDPQWFADQIKIWNNSLI